MAAHTPTAATFAVPVQPDQPATAWAPWLREIAGAMNQLGAKVLAVASSFLPLTGGTITGNLTIDGTLTAAGGNITSDSAGSLAIGPGLTTGNGVTTGASGIEVGGARTGDGPALIDFHGTVGSDSDFRILRNAGVNGSVQFQQTGTGAYSFEGGNVGIGTAPGYRLHVAATAAAGTNAMLVASGPAGADSTTGMILFADYTIAGVVGAILRNGTNTVLYSTTSDERLKADIVASDRGLDALLAIQVSDYKMGETSQQGLLAQQVAEHYPEAVHVGGDDPAQEPWLIDYGRLTPLLIRAIQQQQKEIDELKRRLRR